MTRTGSRRPPFRPIVAAVLVCLGSSACSAGGDPTASGSATGDAGPPMTSVLPPTSPASTSAEPSGDTVTDTPVRIVVGNETIEATLFDNPAARSLLDQLPLTLGFSDYGRQEVLAEPPRPLTMDGMPSGESAPAGTIGYYAPSRAVVLYYADVGRYSGLVRIGRMDGNLSLLQGWPGSRPVTIERAG